MQSISRDDEESLKEELSEENSSEVSDRVITEAILNFVDLAGSEKVSNDQNMVDYASYPRSTFVGGESNLHSIKERVKEGQYINKSLFFLTQVISLKADGKRDHIPYRNSSLTKILRSSLGGNSRTAVILCATPTVTQYEQTLSTLRFGQSAKKIENKISVNVMSKTDEEGLKSLISDYERRLKDMEKDKQNTANLLKVIEDLQEQKRALDDRLKKANKLNLNAAVIAGGAGSHRLPPRTSLEGPMQARKPERERVKVHMYHFEYVGILNSVARIEPYMGKLRGCNSNYVKVLTVNIDKEKLKKGSAFAEGLDHLRLKISKLKDTVSSLRSFIDKKEDERSLLEDRMRDLQEHIRKLELQTPLDELSADELDKMERLFSEGVKRIAFEKGRRFAYGPKAGGRCE